MHFLFGVVKITFSSLYYKKCVYLRLDMKYITFAV